MRAFNRGLGTASLVLILVAGLNGPSLAQTSADIEFGDDSSQWANDGECDDPRFTGEGSAAELEDADRGKDATDCRTAFEDGKITLADGEDGKLAAAPATSATTETAEPAADTARPAIDFGDDSSEWANDGECDDPRFTGTGMASELEDADIAKDATDCRTLFEAGSISLVDTDGDDTAATAAPASTRPEDIDFGDDTSEWANDGECDDPRFAGTGSASELEDVDIGRDATDCRAAFEAGTVTLVGESDATTIADIDFGDDSSEWANDQECDDPRFVGSGMATEPSDVDIMRDATDCRKAFEDGTITLASEAGDAPMTPVSSSVIEALAARIDFGDDSGAWPNDGECDDPDFVGSGVVSDPSDSERMKDASDCRAAFLAGTASLKSAEQLGGAFDYGSDTSEWANDGQCDDWRFAGPGMAKKLSSYDVMGDATDCRALEEAGEISIKPVFDPNYILGAPYDSSEIDFGDNSSSYANDNICDDPRFEGPGVASTLLDSDLEKDAADCKALFEQGKIVLR
ncbi:hypothetical protein SAMN06295905_3441 [Devosia lucknowensis]|uniref:Uncharacterized protein n=1 Tax=Devosia lucknowensis TaxID=1096929 RepID=A0A1Y6G7H8_9HYPH|nr:hypothetical protein [Devosia lucknowensis]SMQ86142.1 hypothetical protein SAMN06295905_3441 [Devosia lucknowensis]